VVALDVAAARSAGTSVPRTVGRSLLLALGALLFGLGWAAGRGVTAVRAATLWGAAAVALGWRSARPEHRGDGG